MTTVTATAAPTPTPSTAGAAAARTADLAPLLPATPPPAGTQKPRLQGCAVFTRASRSLGYAASGGGGGDGGREH